jgi:hypothetical protein
MVCVLHCRHTSDSKLAEQLVHALKEYRYDDNRGASHTKAIRPSNRALV